MRVTFVVDAPGWAFDRFVARVRGEMTCEVTVHYLCPSVQALLSGGPRSDVPAGSEWYYWCTWVMFADARRRGVLPLGRHAVDVTSDACLRRRPAFVVAASAADVVFSQLPGVGDVFHPFPVEPRYLEIEHAPRARVVGMVANGYRDQHKGVPVAQEAVALMPGWTLEVAGSSPLGMLDTMSMGRWLASLDRFLVLSESEGFSAAIVDALAVGVPVVGTPVSPLEPWGAGLYRRVDRGDIPGVRAALLAPPVCDAGKLRQLAAGWTGVGRTIEDTLRRADNPAAREVA